MIYDYFRLTQSYIAVNRTRQQIVLNGTFDNLQQDKQKLITNRIKEFLRGTETTFLNDDNQIICDFQLTIFNSLPR